MRKLMCLCGGLAVLAGLTACKEKPAEVVVSETRELNSSDKPPKLGATSDQRFGRPGTGGGAPAAGGRYAFNKPDGWVEKPGTSMRLLNFAAGPEGSVEIYLSETRGGLIGNIGRWYRQFGLAEPGQDELSKLPRLVIMSGEAILVEASGTYSPGMGKAPSEGYGLMGAIAATEGGVLTIKMVGPEASVKDEMERFKAFCSSLKPVE